MTHATIQGLWIIGAIGLGFLAITLFIGWISKRGSGGSSSLSGDDGWSPVIFDGGGDGGGDCSSDGGGDCGGGD